MHVVKAAVRRIRDPRGINGRAPILERPSGTRTFADFLAALLAVESGIDPAHFATYVRDYASPVVRYPRVAAPGRIVRDPASGEPQRIAMTVAQYFAALGVDWLFDPANPACIVTMQYASTNALGFVGYQFGETALMGSGHYRAETVTRVDARGRTQTYPSYYLGSVPARTWSGGRTEVEYRIPSTGEIVVATDVNRWRGSFTGKSGIYSLRDLKDPLRADDVMRDRLQRNHTALCEIFAQQRTGRRSRCFTWSSLLAAAHLCGVYAAASFALAGTPAHDEFATGIERYIDTFADFATPFDAPERGASC